MRLLRTLRSGSLILFLGGFCGSLGLGHPEQSITIADPDPNRFQQAIESFQRWDGKNSFPSEAALFVGSSSIRLWQTHDSFPQHPVINRGFGGAHISDLLHFFENIVGKYRPVVIIFYAGDNDIAAGKPVTQVFADFREFMDRVRKGPVPANVLYLPIKPSLSRWRFWPTMRAVNDLIREYAANSADVHYVDVATPMLARDGAPRAALFADDGLHLNANGYQLWNEVLHPHLESAFPAQGK